MSKYILFLGGTGAKCAEAFCHMCMAGMKISADPVHVLLADADGNNGNMTQAWALLERYVHLYREIHIDDDIKKSDNDELFDQAMFRQELIIGQWIIDTGTTGSRDGAKLADLNNDNTFSMQLMQCLYTSDEMEAVIPNVGFHARPNVGTAILNAALRGTDGTSYGKLKNSIKDHLQRGDNVQVMLVGSMFGGTGASCMPSIAKDIRGLQGNGDSKIYVGSTMVLPYYKFSSGINEHVQIDSSAFLDASISSIEYYGRNQQIFHANYLIGSPVKYVISKTALGANTQKNPAMLPEWEAALACFDFFKRDQAGQVNACYFKGCNVQTGNGSDKLEWSWEHFSQPEVGKRMGPCIRFALFYTYTLRPEIESINKKQGSKRTNYYYNYLDKNRVEKEETLKMLDQSVSRFIEWFIESLQLHPNEKQQVLVQEMLKVNSEGEIIIKDGTTIRYADNMATVIRGMPTIYQGYQYVNQELGYARFGRPQGNEKGLDRLLQGLYRSCART